MLMNNDNEFGDRLQLEDEQQEDSHAFHFNHHLDHVRRWRAKIESFIIDGGWQQICISFLIATVGHWVRKLIATWTNDEEERREFICRLTKYQNISLDWWSSVRWGLFSGFISWYRQTESLWSCWDHKMFYESLNFSTSGIYTVLYLSSNSLTTHISNSTCLFHFISSSDVVALQSIVYHLIPDWLQGQQQPQVTTGEWRKRNSLGDLHGPISSFTKTKPDDTSS